MNRNPPAAEDEIRGRIETIGRQIENFTEEAAHQRESAAYNEELVECLTKLRADYTRLLSASEPTRRPFADASKVNARIAANLKYNA